MYAVFQVTTYIINLWERVLRDRKELPIVIPIIFYHGIKPWNYETDARKNIPNFNLLADYIKERIPTIKHDLIIMRDHDEKRMEGYKPLTRSILRSFKYIYFDKDTLLGQFVLAIDELHHHLTDDNVQRLIDLILFYFSQSNRAFTEEELIRKVRTLDGKGEEIMSLLQEGENKGIFKEMEKGREKSALNMLRDALSIDRVAKYTELPIEKIKELENNNK